MLLEFAVNLGYSFFEQSENQALLIFLNYI